MHEQRPVEHKDNRPLEYPPAVATAGREGFPVCEVSRGILFVEIRRCRRIVGDPLPCQIGPVGSFTLGRLFFLRELAELGIRGVFQLAGHVHSLVVSQQDMHRSACLRRFLLEPHQQFDDIPGSAAAVHQIPETDQVGGAPRPAAGFVDDARLAQDAH